MRCITEFREAHTSSRGHPPQHHNKLVTFPHIRARPEKHQHTEEREQKRSKLSADVKISKVAGEMLNENARAILTSRLRHYHTEERKKVWTGIQLRLPILNGTNNFLYEFLLFPLESWKE